MLTVELCALSENREKNTQTHDRPMNNQQPTTNRGREDFNGMHESSRPCKALCMLPWLPSSWFLSIALAVHVFLAFELIGEIRVYKTNWCPWLRTITILDLCQVCGLHSNLSQCDLRGAGFPLCPLPHIEKTRISLNEGHEWGQREKRLPIKSQKLTNW